MNYAWHCARVAERGNVVDEQLHLLRRDNEPAGRRRRGEVDDAPAGARVQHSAVRHAHHPNALVRAVADRQPLARLVEPAARIIRFPAWMHACGETAAEKARRESN